MRQYVIELLRHRDLLCWLAAKEIKVRYKLPWLGVLWAFLAPLCLSLILWLVFTSIMPMPAARCPFFLLLLTGLLPWNFFAQSVSHATMSVLDAGTLIRSTAFPRALVPLSIVAANLFNFLTALLVMMAVMGLSGFGLGRWIWLLPLAIGAQVLLTTGLALIVSGLQVRYRDVKYLTELGLLAWFYVTPIIYPLELMARGPAALRLIGVMNPLVGVVELYRLALFGPIPGPGFVAPAAVFAVTAVGAIGACAIGLAIFRRHEPTFADWVAG